MPFRVALLFLTGFIGASCTDDDLVEIQGVVAVGSPDSVEPASSVTVQVLDGVGTQIDEVVTSADGVFRAQANPGEAVHVVATDGDGYKSSFRGIAGMNPRTYVPAGYVHTFGSSSLEYWQGVYQGCEGIGQGGLTIGQIIVDIYDDMGEQPIAHAAGVDLFDLEGNHLKEACYLNAEGTALDAEADEVGETGYFAAFGLPAGRLILRIDSHLVEGQDHIYEFDLLIPESGAAPRFPILIPFEL